jgi:hypothetical protein
MFKQRLVEALPPWMDPEKYSPDPSVLPVTDLWSINDKISLKRKKGGQVKSKVGQVFRQNDQAKRRRDLAESLKYPLAFPKNFNSKSLQALARGYQFPGGRIALPTIYQTDEDAWPRNSTETRARSKLSATIRLCK